LDFNNLIGNSKIKEYLTNTASKNQNLHSYIFAGREGIGKKLFAMNFAKMLLCMEDKKPCNSCKSCISFDGGNHTDFMMINADDGKSIKIEQIRLMQEKVVEKPIISNKKVYIINDAELMTKEAQNCLLKTLEEPPEYVIIILIVSNESKLLNTVKSRCVKIEFSKLSNEEINNYLEKSGIEKLSSSMLEQCDGSLKSALTIGEKAEEYKEIEKIIDNLSKQDIAKIWNSSEILYKSQDEIFDFLDYINVILYNKLIKDDKIAYINSINTVEQTKKNLLANANYNMCIDSLLLKLWEEFNGKCNRS
jgi:DNA polymerase-3 subunit delta'